MYSRKTALSLARQFRTCPPLDIRHDPAHSERVRCHCANCSCCSRADSYDINSWDILAQQLQFFSARQTSVNESIGLQPGQIRRMDSNLGRWVNDHYYTPPCVMILDVFLTTSGHLRVAPIYHDTALAAPGDLILQPHQTGLTRLFVECWNTFHIKCDQTEILLGYVSNDIVQAVEQMSDDPDILPEWAELTRPLTKDDPRIRFRELEREVSRIFSATVNNKSTTETHTATSKTASSAPFSPFQNTEKAISDIRAVIPTMQWAIEPALPEEVFALAEFPADQMPLAAADNDVQTVIAKQIVIHDHTVISVTPLLVEIYMTHSVQIQNGLAVSGRLIELKKTKISPRLICIATLFKGKKLAASMTRLDIKTGSFVSEFQTAAHTLQTLNIAVVYDMP
jgi:hypothetical protein